MSKKNIPKYLDSHTLGKYSIEELEAQFLKLVIEIRDLIDKEEDMRANRECLECFKWDVDKMIRKKKKI